MIYKKILNLRIPQTSINLKKKKYFMSFIKKN